ncbi:MAG TPA: AAA family ATPase [Candidatus Angelobacter sp.]|nr:AAA family ATPase [Candidatus Angelobacter sp.]
MEGRRDTKAGITRIAIKGFKSLAREVSVDLAPLTILAGANSSGKSSVMQPLLLLKQTLEASYDPGSLLLSGPNINFTSASQFLSSVGTEKAEHLEIAVSSEGHGVRFVFGKAKRSGIEIVAMEYGSSVGTFTVRPGMNHSQIQDEVPEEYRRTQNWYSKNLGFSDDDFVGAGKLEWEIVRERCFLTPHWNLRIKEREDGPLPWLPAPTAEAVFAPRLTAIIHLPGLRGTPERTYPVTAVENKFSGTFPVYTASVILRWQLDKNYKKLAMVGKDLERLGLAWRVLARQIQDTQVEIEVSRLPRRSRLIRDYVSIADVGLGLSQVLPLVVALHAASPGQLVYLEQPEIHLHPRAQREFAVVLIDAVHRGVRVVVETHSSLLLLGIQTAVAEAKLSSSDVCLHWFQRDEEGVTSVRSGSLDATGAFGDWPEDFADVELESESRYLDAADQMRLKVQ